MTVDRVKLVARLVKPHFEKGTHWDDIPKDDVKELLSANSTATVGKQIYQAVNETIKFLQEKCHDEVAANNLKRLRSSVARPKGRQKKVLSDSEIKEIQNLF